MPRRERRTSLTDHTIDAQWAAIAPLLERIKSRGGLPNDIDLRTIRCTTKTNEVPMAPVTCQFYIIQLGAVLL